MSVDKQVKIKINCIKRLTKENHYYDNEILKMAETISEMIEIDPTNYEIAKKNELLQETIITQKTTKILTVQYIKDLQMFVDKHLEKGDISQELIEEINLI
jgi:hypothetical protein|uniref:Uncharacterized protein n=1 Tax=viral metagenome TaxID=1070528 RepID=A0A6C0LJV4_9ZZZZ